jgi:hypothetical protein
LGLHLDQKRRKERHPRFGAQRWTT